MSFSASELMNNTNQTQPAAAPAPANSDAFSAADLGEAKPAPTPTVPTAPLPKKSLLDHVKDTASAILSDVGLPSTRQEYHEANRLLKTQIAHPIETAEQIATAGTVGALQPNDVQALHAAKESYDKGDYVRAARHFTNYLIPIVGGLADKAGDAVDNREWGKAIGHTVSAILPFLFGNAEEHPITSEAEAAKATARQYVEPKPVVSDRGTVAGPRTIVGPTTQTTAGVEAPISALQQENPSLIAKGAQKLTTPNAAVEFQRERTAPAATRQLVSTVGQATEDKIANLDAIRNGDSNPELISGTQTPSKFQTFDEAAQAAKSSASRTYEQADDISNREVSAWQQKVKDELDAAKAAVDRHNANVDAYNAELPQGASPMEHEVFDPNKIALPEKPQSYSELKADLDRAHNDARSGDAAVREEAFKTGIPKAQKAIDNWFKQHEDEISPAEYEAAKKLYADSERIQDVANGLRAAQSQNAITGNKLRGLEASIDNKMIRRGQAPGAFQRLLGPEAYENWQNVSKLFDPAPGTPKGFTSWGAWLGEYAAAHLFGIYGMAGKAASEFLMNRVMFSPEWGSWFSRAANIMKQLWTRQHGELGAPGSVGGEFEPELSDGMREEFNKLMDRTLGQNEGQPVQSNPIEEHIRSGRPYAILTGENPNYDYTTSPEINAENNRRLVGDLTRQGYKPIAAVGMGGERPENSFFVPDIKPSEARALVNKYGQAEIVTHRGIEDVPSGKLNQPAVGATFGNEARAQQYHTRVGNEAVSLKLAPTEEMANALRDFHTEKDFADRYLAGDAKLEDFPYYDSYRKTINAESRLLQPGRTLFIGGGPIPLSSIMLSDNPKFSVDTLELDPRAARIGENVAARARAGTIEFKTGDARSFDGYKNYDNVVIALEAGPEAASKYEVLKKVMDEVRPGTTVLARGSADTSFVNVEKNLPKGVRIVKEIPTFDGYSKTFQLEKEPVSGTFEAHHWSGVPNLTETNPEMMGTGVRGAERARMGEPGFLKRTNFGTEGYKEPAVQNKPYRYVANLDKSKYYDISSDPDGIWAKGWQQGGATGAERAVRDAGYHGYRAGNEVASFEKVPVRPAETPLAERQKPVYIDKKNGMHQVVTGPQSDRAGELLAQDVEGEEGKPSTEVRISTNWRDPDPKYKGVGAEQIVELARSLPKEKTALLSDTSMTPAARGSWRHVQEQYPLAVSEDKDGGFKFDLEKLRAPATRRTTMQVSPDGSSVRLMSDPLPIKGTGEGGAPTTVDVAKALNKYTKRALGALQPGSEPEEMVARAKELAEDEARYQLAQNNSGTTWYTEQMDQHDNILRQMRPELADDTKLSLFKFGEAVLSSGQKPYGNFKAAVRAWDAYAKTGEFLGTNPETGKSWGPRGANAYANAFGAINQLISEKGEKGAVDWLLSEHPVSELREYNKNVAGKRGDMRYGNIVLGEKRGPFAMNLHKMETAFTADMWVSRTWNRWMGTIEVAPDGELASDAPRNMQERALMKQSFSEVAQKLGLTTSSLQAVLWYYEQALYSAHGTPKESWSFSDAAARAQAEENAARAAGTQEAPAEPVSFGPRPGEGQYRDEATAFNPEDFTEPQQRVATVGIGQNAITANVPEIQTASDWKGKPEPTVYRNDPQSFRDYADYANANAKPESIVVTTAHELAHAFIHSFYQDFAPTAEGRQPLRIKLGYEATEKGKRLSSGDIADDNSVVSGYMSPGDGTQDAYDKAQTREEKGQVIKQYVIGLMGGRAIEEILGEPKKDIDRSVSNDELQSRKAIAEVFGVRDRVIADGLIRSATEKAKQILLNNYDAFSHMVRQGVNHWGKGMIDEQTFHQYRNGAQYKGQ